MRGRAIHDFLRGRGKRELFGRIGQRVMGDQRRDVTEFGGVGLRNLRPRWDAVEKIGNAYGRARSKAGWFNTDEFASREFHACAFGFAGVAASRSRRETAAMEGSASPRKPSVEMESRSSAVRSLFVAWRSKREKSVIVSHAVAVVDDANHPLAAHFGFNANGRGARHRERFPEALYSPPRHGVPRLRLRRFYWRQLREVCECNS